MLLTCLVLLARVDRSTGLHGAKFLTGRSNLLRLRRLAQRHAELTLRVHCLPETFYRTCNWRFCAPAEIFSNLCAIEDDVRDIEFARCNLLNGNGCTDNRRYGAYQVGDDNTPSRANVPNRVGMPLVETRGQNRLCNVIRIDEVPNLQAITKHLDGSLVVRR